jgi:hypothetical protein
VREGIKKTLRLRQGALDTHETCISLAEVAAALGRQFGDVPLLGSR